MPLSERRELNFDHPDAFDTDLLVSQLRDLKSGKVVEKHVYDFVTSTRRPETTRVMPGDLILIEGILVLHIEPIRKELDVR